MPFGWRIRQARPGKTESTPSAYPFDLIASSIDRIRPKQSHFARFPTPIASGALRSFVTMDSVGTVSYRSVDRYARRWVTSFDLKRTGCLGSSRTFQKNPFDAFVVLPLSKS